MKAVFWKTPRLSSSGLSDEEQPWALSATRFSPKYKSCLTTGQENSNGLMYMRNRYYNPLTGAFTQTDPIGLAGGLNTYGYAEGNPVSYSDPYGLRPCPPDNDCEPETFSGRAIRAAEQWFADKAEQALETAVGVAEGVGKPGLTTLYARDSALSHFVVMTYPVAAAW